MAKRIGLPPIGNPPMPGRVIQVHRMPGHYVVQGEPVLSLRVGLDIVAICSPEAGKIMRCRDVGEVIQPGWAVLDVASVGSPTWELFIAYRRADASGHAGRIGERLIRDLGAGQVFKDIEALPPGVDFVDVVRDRLQRATAMVVIIGPQWLTLPDRSGGRKIDNQNDLHREEIRTALVRGIAIFPVLVNGAQMPHQDDVPEDIRPFTRRQAVEVSDTRWEHDVGVLSQAVSRALADSPRRRAFLAQVPADPEQSWHWIQDEPPVDAQERQ